MIYANSEVGSKYVDIVRQLKIDIVVCAACYLHSCNIINGFVVARRVTLAITCRLRGRNKRGGT